ncbi:YhgE/Pip family protein [Bifidobacterium choloepi]|uniref:YhgE/Pip domain-containing protein n=1 Tax=Bifidobacterium choloepi TaxID=2614131 RepID=A0A6I5N7P6_9BIFI|nr:YhgE/Pip domain-containing protein [Bifidobacterium choloepi]NEG69871.1 YhgE/Pip domain-containing protein [Bifidobacterium choloepi]
MTGNVVSIIIAIGLVVIPGLFAWFNIGACWDPFANTGNLKFAIANEDEGYTSDLLPTTINVGDDIVNTLHENSDLDWTFTTADQAIDGTKSGTYYGAVVIPKDFSKDLMTFFTSDATHATLDYYDNEKLNALAPKITGQGADEIAYEINEMFAKTITSSALSIMSSLIDQLSTPEAQTRLQNFSGNIGDLASSLGDSATALTTYSDLTTATQQLLDSSVALVKNADSSAQDAVNELKDAKSSVDDLTGALDTTVTTLGNAISAASTSLGSVSTQLDTLLDDSSTTATDAATSLTSLDTQVDTVASDFQSVRDAINTLAGNISGESSDNSTATTVASTAKSTLESVVTRLDSAISLIKQVSSDLTTASQKITDKTSAAADDKAAVKSLISQATAAIDGISSDFDSDVKPDLTSMNTAFTSAASELSTAVGELKSAFGDLDSTTADADTALANARSAIADAASSMTQTASKLTDFQTKLDDALKSGDLQKVKDIIGTDTSTLAATLAAPVSLETKAIYPVANFGTSMTPYYTFIPLWTGSLLLVVCLKTSVSRRRQKELGNPKPHQLFIGHYLFFLLLAELQVTFSMAGTLLFLRVQAIHPLLFFCSGWLSALVYSLFVYTMVLSFGNIGKAIGVLMLVMQISGSNGAYPLVLLPTLTQEISPWLPMTYSIKAIRGAIAGIYANDYWIAMGHLALFIPPLLLLGLLVRKPLMGFNRWYAAKVESTKLLG